MSSNSISKFEGMSIIFGVQIEVQISSPLAPVLFNERKKRKKEKGKGKKEKKKEKGKRKKEKREKTNQAKRSIPRKNPLQRPFN